MKPYTPSTTKGRRVGWELTHDDMTASSAKAAAKAASHAARQEGKKEIINQLKG